MKISCIEEYVQNSDETFKCKKLKNLKMLKDEMDIKVETIGDFLLIEQPNNNFLAITTLNLNEDENIVGYLSEDDKAIYKIEFIENNKGCPKKAANSKEYFKFISDFFDNILEKSEKILFERGGGEDDALGHIVPVIIIPSYSVFYAKDDSSVEEENMIQVNHNSVLVDTYSSTKLNPLVIVSNRNETDMIRKIISNQINL
jgi:hypothetical protein